MAQRKITIQDTKNTKSTGVLRNDCGDVEDTSSSNAHEKESRFQAPRNPNVSEISGVSQFSMSMLSEAVSEMTNGESLMSMLSGASEKPSSDRFSNSSDDYEEDISTPSFEGFENFLDDDEDLNRCYDYGEPTRFQHLRIDFTPIQGVDDDEELFQKCVGFWDFVNSRSELRNMLVEPVKIDADATTSYSNQYKESQRSSDIPQVKKGMQWTEDLPMAYLGKLSLEYCTDKPQEYKLPSDKSSESSGSVGAGSKFWVKPKKEIVQRTYYDEEQTKNLNAEMEKFDKEHPRCFDPPRSVARTLITAELKRRLPTIYPN